jgi:hypothetical protein
MTWLDNIGGLKSIGRVAEKLTPLKVGLYLAGGLLVIVSFASRIPEVLALVFREAFNTQAAAGGTMGFLIAMRYGLARGMYANEAGYGTAAVAYGTAQSRRPLDQGLNAVMEVFIVSFVTSTISAMVVLLSGAYLSGLTSTAAVAHAFNQTMPTVGGWVVAFCVFLFGYPVDLLPAHSVGRRVEGRARVGVGRPDECPADLSEHHRRAGFERARRQDCPRAHCTLSLQAASCIAFIFRSGTDVRSGSTRASRCPTG